MAEKLYALTKVFKDPGTGSMSAFSGTDRKALCAFTGMLKFRPGLQLKI